MIWPQNQDRYNQLARLDPATGSFHLYSRETLENEESIDTSGWFSMLANRFWAIYKRDSNIVLQIDKTPLTLSNEVSIEVEGPPDNRLITISEGNRKIVQHRYALEPDQQFRNDPTPFIEEEHFDFGLFLVNVATNRERRTAF